MSQFESRALLYSMALLVLSGLHGTEANASQLKQKKKMDSLCKDIGVSQLWLRQEGTAVARKGLDSGQKSIYIFSFFLCPFCCK